MRTWILVFVLTLSGCVEVHPPRNGRFSVDNTKMQKDESFPDTWVYRHPTKKPTDYQKFMLDRVSVYDDTAKHVKKEDRAIFDNLENHLTAQLEDDFQKYTLVTEPGEGVLEIQISIIDIKPIVHYINKDGNEAIRYDGSAVGSKFEIDCVDSKSLEPVFVISTLYTGDDFDAYENVSDLNNVEKAYKDWNQFFKKRFDEAMSRREPAGSR